MNPINQMKELKIDATDKFGKELQLKIRNKVWDIVKKVPLGNMKSKDVNELDRLYKEYFKAYPDVEKENNANKRIKQLRILQR